MAKAKGMYGVSAKDLGELLRVSRQAADYQNYEKYRDSDRVIANQVLQQTAARFGLNISPISFSQMPELGLTAAPIQYDAATTVDASGASRMRSARSWEAEGRDISGLNTYAGFVYQLKTKYEASQYAAPTTSQVDYAAQTKAALDSILATIQGTSAPSINEAESAYLNRKDEVSKLRMRGIGRFIGDQPLSPITSSMTGSLDRKTLGGEDDAT